MRVLLGLTMVLSLAGCYDPADNCLNDRSAKIGAYVASQSIVKTKLRSPSSAKFPAFGDRDVNVLFEWKCNFKVAGFVDAQNAFGGTVRTRYIIEIKADPETGGYTGRNLLMD